MSNAATEWKIDPNGTILVFDDCGHAQDEVGSSEFHNPITTEVMSLVATWFANQVRRQA